MSEANPLPPSPVRRLIKFLLNIAPVFAMLSALFTGGASLLSLGAWTLFRANEAAIWAAVRSGIGIEQIEDSLRELRGDNRIVQVEAGSAYAVEPVSIGEDLTLNFTIRRTSLGQGCQIISGTPIFKDFRNTPMPGEILTPLQNFGTDWVPAQTVVRMPSRLEPGRVRVSIQLLYNCSGASVPDQTPAIPFTLLKG